ncbi:MAG: 16S rRNA (guanine(966)-N(2))-methyltransferase RsmD [Clostridia bacterium]|nr:16S rRNA (guanine(966)-N(2))-methyltransferase RsmD [Clostridia bacterium]
MRIIAGKYRGLNLAEFKGGEIRPTADRVKESLFNILGRRVIGAEVLDLFCGSGNLGIECLSRGAKSVHFNDISKASIEVFKKNASKLSGKDKFTVTAYDFKRCLKMTEDFDIIFIDPPYASDAGIEALKIISRGDKLKFGGIAVYERDRAFEGEIAGLEMFDERKYGKTYLSFFTVEGY